MVKYYTCAELSDYILFLRNALLLSDNYLESDIRKLGRIKIILDLLSPIEKSLMSYEINVHNHDFFKEDH